LNSAAAGEAVHEALAAIERIANAGNRFRAAVEKRFGAEVATREATWLITKVHRYEPVSDSAIHTPR
jgi:hypothetical protein